MPVAEETILQTAMDKSWQTRFWEVVAKTKSALKASTKRREGPRETFVRLLKGNVQATFGGTWQCFAGAKYAFNIRTGTQRGYRQEYAICTVLISGSIHHVFVYRSPPKEADLWDAGPQPQPEPESDVAVGTDLKVTHTDMTAAKASLVVSTLSRLLGTLRMPGKCIDDAELANAVKETLQVQLKLPPTWHVIAGTDKLSSWDAAVTAEPGTQFSAQSQAKSSPIKIQIFRHNVEALPAVAHAVRPNVGQAVLTLAYCATAIFALSWLLLGSISDSSATLQLTLPSWLSSLVDIVFGAGTSSVPVESAVYLTQSAFGSALLSAVVLRIVVRVAKPKTK
jgi:hypothetical protein